MEISQNKMVSVIYELTHDNANGKLIEKIETANPLRFVYGSGNMLEKFEMNIKGLKAGEKFEFTLNSDEAYGPIEKEAVVELPMDIFKIDGKIDMELLALGNTVPMMDNHGNRLMGIVREVKENFVSMDFNHPLAGENIHFRGEIVEIHEASEKEIQEAMSGGSGCSDSDCGCCGGGCN